MMVSEAEIEVVRTQTGMDRLQAIYHLRARHQLQRRFEDRSLTLPR